MTQRTKADLTALLHAWKDDDDTAARDRLFELVEAELASIARAALAGMGGLRHKVEPRELINEMYLKIANHPSVWKNRHLFFGMVSRVMRRILLDTVKEDRAQKRPPTAFRLGEDALALVPAREEHAPIDSFYRALDELKSLNERHGQAIELHYLCGATLADLATLFGVSLGTVKRELRSAKAWIKVRLAQS